MKEHIQSAVNNAFDDNVADMQSSIENALQYKIINALEQKRIEIAKSLITNESTDPDEDEEDLEEGLVGKQHKIDANKNNKIDAQDFKLLKKKKKDDTCCEGWDDDEDADVAKADRELKRMKAKPIAAAKINPDKDVKIQKTKKDREEEMEESYIEEKLDASMGVKKYIDDFIKSDNPKFEGKSKKERIQMALGAFYSAKKGKTRNEELEIQEGSPSAGLSTKEKSEVVKKAKSGKDIGKKGKGFSKVEAAAKKWGATDPKAVAASVMWKNIKRK